jgi:hypothetical protein
LTDVSRLRSYRCAIKPATAPTITVRRINSHVQSLTTGHESNPVRRGRSGLLRRFAPRKKVGGLGGRNLFIGRHFHPTGSANGRSATRNDDGLNQSNFILP